MTRRIVLACMLVLAVAMVASAADPLGSERNPIIWAFVPSGDTAQISAGAQSVADMLHASTGLYFKTFVATDYVGVIEAMQAYPPKAHMASLATAAYILAADIGVAQAALVAVRNGAAYYQAEIIARHDSGIKTLKDLRGRTFARVEPLSASGWIVPSLMIKGVGIDPEKDMKVVDAGAHPAVALAVYSGQADAGACYIDARANIQKDHPDVMEKVDVIAVSSNIPNDGVQFQSTVPIALRAKIVDGILGLLKTDAGKAALNKAYQWTGLEKHDDSFYDPFRQVLQAAGATADVLLPKKK
jgi:phosphonate transport system substrate-binding protein